MPRKHFSTDRFGALSDGIFAIAMTLLVLELKMPDLGNTPFKEVFIAVAPKVEGWIFSFFVIGALWVLHHNVLSLIKRTTTAFLWMNLFFLMLISFMPWPTWLIGSYRNNPLALTLFSGTLGCAGLIVLALWIYAAKDSRLTAEGVNLKNMPLNTWLIIRIPIVAILSIIIAFIDPQYALMVWLLHAILGYGVRKYFVKAGKVKPEVADAI